MIGIPWWRTSFGEKEAAKVREAILGEHISMGSITEEFENKLAKELGCKYVVATTSGSTALLMACMALDIKPGDEVIVPNRTWIATAHSPLILGAKVSLVDCEKERTAVDVSKIEEKITENTKAILPVHLNGRAVDMRGLNRIAKEHGIAVIEDACQAMFSKNKQGCLGTQSEIGCFSLGVTKLISTGQGGFMALNDSQLYEKLKLIRGHGTVSVTNPVYNLVGSNFRFNDILSSIGLVQLEKYKENLVNVNKVYNLYLEQLEGINKVKMIPVNVKEGEVPLYAEALCDNREKLTAFLASKSIDIRPYLPNLSSAHYLRTNEIFSNSDRFEKYGVFLPCGPAQPIENIQNVIAAIKEYEHL